MSGDNAEVTISGTIKATWYDENNQQVPNHRLGEELWHCGGLFTLEIEVNNVSVATKYGNPRSRFYGNGQIINYIFLSGGNNICFLKPKDMTIRDILIMLLYFILIRALSVQQVFNMHHLV